MRDIKSLRLKYRRKLLDDPKESARTVARFNLVDHPEEEGILSDYLKEQGVSDEDIQWAIGVKRSGHGGGRGLMEAIRKSQRGEFPEFIYRQVSREARLFGSDAFDRHSIPRWTERNINMYKHRLTPSLERMVRDRLRNDFPSIEWDVV